MKRLTVLLVVLPLFGCGSATQLKPAQGKRLPVAPYGATAPLTPAQLMTPTTQERPMRSDELLTNSIARRSDEFDLPPQ